jgi:hypothetical protein
MHNASDKSKQLGLAAQTLLSIHVPYPPPPLWPNNRPHWSQRARCIKTQRYETSLITRAAIAERPRWIPLRAAQITILLHCPGSAPDPDNAIAALKSTIDGLVDGGALADDNQLTFTFEAIVPKTEWAKLYPAAPTSTHARSRTPAELRLPYPSAVFMTISPFIHRT